MVSDLGKVDLVARHHTTIRLGNEVQLGSYHKALRHGAALICTVILCLRGRPTFIRDYNGVAAGKLLSTLPAHACANTFTQTCEGISARASTHTPVSYTHLDVYKRQIQ